MLKNKSELLQKKNLFDKKFREQISETVKAHKQSKQLLASAIFKDARNGNQPRPRKQHRGGGGGAKFLQKQQ